MIFWPTCAARVLGALLATSGLAGPGVAPAEKPKWMRVPLKFPKVDKE